MSDWTSKPKRIQFTLNMNRVKKKQIANFKMDYPSND